MSKWNEIVVQALNELGADRFFTTGAKLKRKVQDLGDAQGEDLESYLQESGQKFGEFLEGIVGEDVQIQRSPGTDIRVGLSGASSQRTEPTRLRDDVYRSLISIGEQHYYVKSQDAFTSDTRGIPPDDIVALPTVELETLIRDRRAFLEQLSDEGTAAALLQVIDESPSPLRDFQAALPRYDLARAWHQFNVKVLLDRLNKWASQNGIPAGASWAAADRPRFRAGGYRESPQFPQSSQALLSRLADYMTEDEIRPLLIPFRAVEELYHDLNRKASST